MSFAKETYHYDIKTFKPLRHPSLVGIHTANDLACAIFIASPSAEKITITTEGTLMVSISVEPRQLSQSEIAEIERYRLSGMIFTYEV